MDSVRGFTMSLNYSLITFADGVEGYYTEDYMNAYLEIDGKVVARVKNKERAWEEIQRRGWEVALKRIHS